MKPEKQKERRRRQRPGTVVDNAAPVQRLPRWLSTALCLVALAAVVFVLTFRPVTDPDTWFHLEAGEWISENGAVPRTDKFSFTAGDTPYVPSGWLTAVLMHRLDAIYPDSSLGPILMVTFAIGLAVLIVLMKARRHNTLVLTTLVLMAGLMAAVVRFSPRPDVWSIAGITALLALLTNGQRNDAPPAAWRLWLLAPLVALWANMHAGVLIAIPFLVVYLGWLLYRYRQARAAVWLRSAVPVAIACFAWLLNPYGFGLVGLALRIARMPKVEWVVEWMPFFKSGFPMAWPITLGAAIVVLALVWTLIRSRKSFHPVEPVWLFMLVAIALLQRRQVGLAAFGIPLILSRHLVPAELWFNNRRIVALATPLAAAAVISWIQISGATGTGGGTPRYGRNCTVLPCYASEFLSANPPPEPIFNSYNLGGYLLHALNPETKVFIDGRLDVYPEQVWLDMLAVEESRLSIDQLLERYGIQTFVISIGDSFGDPAHLASRLAARDDFSLVHLDDLTAVFVRRSVDSAEYLEAHAFDNLDPWNLDKTVAALTSQEQVQTVAEEMGRMLEQSGPSAATASLAAYIAFRIGDSITMNEQLASARSVQPGYPLLQIILNRMTAEQAKARRR